MKARLVLARIADGDGSWDCALEPHPELVLAQRPTVAQVMEAAGILGVFPGGSYLAGEISLSPLPA